MKALRVFRASLARSLKEFDGLNAVGFVGAVRNGRILIAEHFGDELSGTVSVTVQRVKESRERASEFRRAFQGLDTIHAVQSGQALFVAPPATESGSAFGVLPDGRGFEVSPRFVPAFCWSH